MTLAVSKAKYTNIFLPGCAKIATMISRQGSRKNGSKFQKHYKILHDDSVGGCVKFSSWTTSCVAINDISSYRKGYGTYFVFAYLCTNKLYFLQQ